MRFAITATAALLLASTAAGAFAQTAAPAPSPLPASVTSNLPRIARPLHYRIDVRPDAQTLTFSGTESVTLVVFQATDYADAERQRAHDRLGQTQPGQRQGRGGEPQRQARSCGGASPVHCTESRSARALTASTSPTAARSTLRPTDCSRSTIPTAHRQDRAQPVHAVRGARRPPLRPEVRRARLQGDLRAVGGGPGEPDGDQQHADREVGACGRGAQARLLPADAEDVELPAVLRHRRLRPRGHEGQQRGRSRRRRSGRQRRAGTLCDGVARRAAALLRRLLRPEIPAAQARQRRRPGPVAVLRSDGELGRDLHLQPRAAQRSGEHQRRAPAGDLRGPGARNGAPVVRRHGDDGLVGRHLAQRGLRQLDGDQSHRPFPSRVVPAARPGRRARGRDGARQLQDHPPDRAAHALGRRDQPGLRFDHLPEGRGGDLDARGLCRRGHLAQRHPQLHRRAQVCQRQDRRLVAGGRGRRRARVDRDRARLHHPAGHPARPRRGHLHQRPDRVCR